MFLRALSILFLLTLSSHGFADNVNVDLILDYDPVSGEFTHSGSGDSFATSKIFQVTNPPPFKWGMNDVGYYGGTVFFDNAVQTINLTSTESYDTIPLKVIAHKVKTRLDPSYIPYSKTYHFTTGTCPSTADLNILSSYIEFTMTNDDSKNNCASNFRNNKLRSHVKYLYDTVENLWEYKLSFLPFTARTSGTYQGTAVLTYRSKFISRDSNDTTTTHTLTVNLTVNVLAGVSSAIAPSSVEVINTEPVGGVYSSSATFPVTLIGFFDDKVKVETTSSNQFKLTCSTPMCAATGNTEIPYTLAINTKEVSQNIDDPSGTSSVEIPISAEDYNLSGGRYYMDFDLSYDVNVFDVTPDTYNDTLTFIFSTVP